MARKLPPLNALSAFEAAALHLSFTKAASELNVTQAAISHQVKALEQHLGLTLFRRLNRRLVLTEAGQLYQQVLRDSFDAIDRGTATLRRDQDRGHLHIRALPSLAATWLSPRKSRFRARPPDHAPMCSAHQTLCGPADTRF